MQAMDSNHEDNPFDRLPDALLVSIFKKILDLEPKTLVSCFLVSKQVTSLLLRLWPSGAKGV